MNKYLGAAAVILGTTGTALAENNNLTLEITEGCGAVKISVDELLVICPNDITLPNYPYIKEGRSTVYTTGDSAELGVAGVDLLLGFQDELPLSNNESIKIDSDGNGSPETEVGISRGTPYTYFEGKYGILNGDFSKIETEINEGGLRYKVIAILEGGSMNDTHEIILDDNEPIIIDTQTSIEVIPEEEV